MSKRLMLFEFLIWSKDKGGRVPRSPPLDPTLHKVAKWAIFVLNSVRVWSPRRHSSTQTSPESAPPPTRIEGPQQGSSIRHSDPYFPSICLAPQMIIFGILAHSMRILAPHFASKARIPAFKEGKYRRDFRFMFIVFIDEISWKPVSGC